MSSRREIASVTVVTYNVLCTHLCSAADVPRCTPDAIDPALRQERIWNKLEPHIGDKHILCLQEVSRDWCMEHLPLFLANKYMLVYGLYGYDRNGYMGVAIAYPTALYHLLDSYMPRVAEDAKWPTAPTAAEPTTQKHVLELANSRPNVLVLLRLQEIGTRCELVVGTYHMPCMYDRPEVMQLHAAAAANQALIFADESPLVLAGDFNFAPDSPGYRIITQRRCTRDEERATAAACSGLDVREHLRTSDVLKSAYVTAGGPEPAFTVYSYSEWNGPNLFSGTIDFIFHSHHFNYAAVLQLPSSVDVFPTPLPTVDEPSDHLLLCARLAPK